MSRIPAKSVHSADKACALNDLQLQPRCDKLRGVSPCNLEEDMPRKGLTEVIVIDHPEKPTKNWASEGVNQPKPVGSHKRYKFCEGPAGVCSQRQLPITNIMSTPKWFSWYARRPRIFGSR
jgi:hypothetical protein